MILYEHDKISTAIQRIDPSAKFAIRGATIDTCEFEWHQGTTPISKADIESEMVLVQAEYDTQEYARNRASAYDSVGNQLDMIYKDNLNGTTTHKDAVEAVKAKYPKPS